MYLLFSYQSAVTTVYTIIINIIMQPEWEQVYNGLLMSNKEFRAFVLVLNGSSSVVENYRDVSNLLF